MNDVSHEGKAGAVGVESPDHGVLPVRLAGVRARRARPRVASRRELRRFQRARGLGVDGIVGPATLHALLHGSSGGGHTSGGGGPISFYRPVNAPITSPFGMRWGRMHTGIDFGAPYGARVGAAGRGTV